MKHNINKLVIQPNILKSFQKVSFVARQFIAENTTHMSRRTMFQRKRDNMYIFFTLAALILFVWRW